MPLRKRIRGPAAEILRDLREVPKARRPMYLSNARIDDVFGDWYPPIKELVSGVGAEIGAESGAFFVKGRVSRTATDAMTITLGPMQKLFLIETAAKRAEELVDLTKEEPRKGPAIHTFLGKGDVFGSGDRVHEHSGIGLSPERAQAIQRERRRRQAEGRKLGGLEKGTFAWVAAEGRFASIGSMNGVNRKWFESHRFPPFGMLGLYERTVADVVLFTALGVWHDQAAELAL